MEPFTWGKDAAQAVYHAVVLEEVAKMAILTLTIDPTPIPHRSVLVKHFMLQAWAECLLWAGIRRLSYEILH